MRLRDFESKDAPFMFEWMQDRDITKFFQTDFSVKTIEDAYSYIVEINNDPNTRSYAIASDEDEYMGTVCLKSIDIDSGYAQLSVVVRQNAMSHGYALFGVREILHIAFAELGLESVYWCISGKNERAVRFYDKHYFKRIVDIPGVIRNMYPDRNDLIWYSVLNGDDYINEALNRGYVAGCRIISIKTIPTVDAGELSFFEGDRDIDFEVKRIYYISKVPEGTRRGFHAHKSLRQLLFCPYGKIQLVLDDTRVREEITLSDPSVGIIIDKPIWREMLWLQKDSVLCVAASGYYDADDYIRNYDDYRRFINNTDKK